MKNKKRILASFIFGLILILGSTAVFVGMNYRDFSNHVARVASKNVQKDEQHVSKNQKKGNKQISKLSYGQAARDDLTSPLKIWQYAHDRSLPIWYAGRIAIPSRNINLPINSGSNNRVLAIGAGTLKDSFAPSPFNQADVMGKSNYAICGHNMDDRFTLFSAVPDMNNGEFIYTFDGKKIYVYEKYETNIISPQNISVIFNTKETDANPIITITTCTYDGTARYEIRGRLLRSYQKNEAPRSIGELFK